MSPNTKSEIAIVGAGTIGAQIAWTLAAFGGNQVSIFDTAAHAEERIRNASAQWADAVGCNFDEVWERLRFTSSLADAVAGVELVIEAIPEELQVKRALFAELSELAPDAILATNSSSLRSRALADVVQRPERLLNAHFYPDPWKRNVVEVMTCGWTSAAIMERTAAILRGARFEPILLKTESTGLLFNRIWRAIKRECLRVMDEGVGEPADIDKLWRANFGGLVGPCQLMDIVGLDTVLAIERVYAEESSDPNDKPSPGLEKRVEEGKLGRKTGEGFYKY